jgi:pyridoxamine 5'-phosphate oxidase
MKGIQNLRVDYSGEVVDLNNFDSDPIKEFKNWFKFAKNKEVIEPNAMVISTFNDNFINSRTVLLKDISSDGFIFFTNYKSKKAVDIQKNDIISSVFLWKKIERQVVIKGNATKIKTEDSIKYFNSRPRKSKIAAWASKQSNKLEDSKDLIERFEYYENKFKDENIPYPDFWGGYLIKPISIEFWQGRSSRMHDRILYEKKSGNWELCKLYP